MNRLLDLWRGLVRNIVQDVPDHLAVAEFGQPNPDDITELADVVTAALAEEKARERRDVRDAAWQRMGEFGDEDMESWGIELLHTDDADIAADYDGLVYAAAWLRLTSMPEPTDLGDL